MLSSVVEIYLVTNVKKPCFIIIILGSNHFGIAGWYGMRAMEQGLIVKYFFNTSTGILYCFSFENEFSDRNITSWLL